MKILIFVFFTVIAQGQTLILKESLDPKTTLIPEGVTLWADQKVNELVNRPLREDLLNVSSMYLQKQLSDKLYVDELNKWLKIGLTEQERSIVLDTLEKLPLSQDQQKLWTCRLDLEKKCERMKFSAKKLAPILQHYEWLIVDGKSYPRISWDEIKLSKSSLNFSFYSSKYQSFNFEGSWDDLMRASPNTTAWVQGNCETFNVDNNVQSLDTNVMLSSQCIKSSIQVKTAETTSFYENHKKWIWVAAGLAVGGLAYKGLNGKNIVIEKPSFK